MARTTLPFTTRRPRGFSLIEVMVAVVILATGLLALAALQGALARNSGDSKARSAVVAALTSRMAEIRQAPPPAGKTWTMTDPWVSSAALQAGSSDLEVVETIAAYRWNGTTYVTTAVDNPDSVFTRATLAASWTGASGSKSLTLASDLSASIYGLGKGYPVVNPNSSAAKVPIVRQDNPSNTAGVIPIVSGNQATAASNPQPIIQGANNNLRVGTSFDVLNYIPEGNTARITKRFETQVIKCRCEFGAAGFSVAGKAQWPAVWDGTTYSVYPGIGNPAGTVANAGESPAFAGSGAGQKVRLQSGQCTECCRDHHDSASAPLEARYDPEATAIGKFNESSGALTVAGSGAYVAACRVVRVDGMWRTTADMYQRHYGLLETSSVNGIQAKTGIPTSSAASSYQTYVKDYLSQYSQAAPTAPNNAASMFDDPLRNLNSPAIITIAPASTTDDRYLHGRGLYVDYLGSKAQQAIGKCTGKTGTAYTECLLPVLPFTTINLTEMARWTASDPTILSINTDKPLNFDVDKPSGGRTRGVKTGSADNNSLMRTSNSGVAINDDIPGAVDTNGDQVTKADLQHFVVGTASDGSTKTGDKFSVGLVNFEVRTSPAIDFTISPSDSGRCDWTGSGFNCPTNSVLPSAGILVVKNYNYEGRFEPTVDVLTISTCSRQSGDNGTISDWNASFSGAFAWPRFFDYSVASATGGGDATMDPAVNPGKLNESTRISLSSIPKVPASITITLQQDSTSDATVSSCVYKKSGSGVVLVSVAWTKPWL